MLSTNVTDVEVSSGGNGSDVAVVEGLVGIVQSPVESSASVEDAGAGKVSIETKSKKLLIPILSILHISPKGNLKGDFREAIIGFVDWRFDKKVFVIQLINPWTDKEIARFFMSMEKAEELANFFRKFQSSFLRNTFVLYFEGKNGMNLCVDSETKYRTDKLYRQNKRK